MGEYQDINTLPAEIKKDSIPVLIYFKTPSIWIVCQWNDDSDDGYNWLAIGSTGDCWSDDDAAFWSSVPDISEADLMRIPEDDQ